MLKVHVTNRYYIISKTSLRSSKGVYNAAYVLLFSKKIFILKEKDKKKTTTFCRKLSFLLVPLTGLELSDLLFVIFCKLK